MKVFIFSVLFVCFIFTQAQEPTPGSSATTTEAPEGSAVIGQCYNGKGTDNITQVACDFTAGEACQTKLESNLGNDLPAIRVCTLLISCLNQPQPDSEKCAGQNGVRLCFYCCQGDLCNNFVRFEDAPQ